MNDLHEFKSHLEASSAAFRIFQAAFPTRSTATSGGRNTRRAKQFRALLEFRAQRQPWKIVRKKCESRSKHAKNRQRDEKKRFAKKAPSSSASSASSALVSSGSSDDSASNGSSAK